MSKQNLMNKDHKATNQKYRKNYDKIKWEYKDLYIDGDYPWIRKQKQKKN